MMLDLLKSLADPCRLRLVAVLLRGEFTVQELTRMFGMGQSRISRHLKILAETGVLIVKRQGTWSYYRVGDSNAFFNAMLPALELGLEQLPQRSEDLAALALVLEERRTRSLEFFDRHARLWDELGRTLLPTPDYRARLLGLIPRGTTILEVGVGTGGLLPELVARAELVIGVDHSPAMLDEARRRVVADGMTGIDLRLGEMTHLPLPDQSVECALANMVLHHAAEPLAVLREVQRVLKPGGAILLADLGRHERESARDQLADQWLGFEETELCDWLGQSGFVDILLERIGAGAGEEDVLLVRGSKRSMD
jgi:SAM-dependent methyltransferase